VVDAATGASTEAPIPLDCWCRSGTIVGSDETKYEPGKLARDAVQKFARLESLLRQGESRCEAYRRVFFASWPRQDFLEKFVHGELSFSTSGGKFYQAMAEGRDLEAAAAKYFVETSPPAGPKHLRELLMVRYLAGSRVRLAPLNSQVTLTSGQTFYPSHGLDVILQADKTDYAAALEGQKRYAFRAALDRDRVVWGITLLWLDDQNKPRDFDMVLRSACGEELKRIAVRDNHERESPVVGECPRPCRTIDCEFLRFSGQPRLLMRHLGVFGSPEINSRLTQEPSPRLQEVQCKQDRPGRSDAWETLIVKRMGGLP
jgi:hypothetical protein